MAASRDIEIPQIMPGTGFGYPVAAGARIFGRALVGLNAAGFAVPLGAASVCFAGIAMEHIDNRDGADAGAVVTVQRDVRAFPVTFAAASIGKDIFAADDDATKITDTSGGTRIGKLIGQTTIQGGAVRAVVNLGA